MLKLIKRIWCRLNHDNLTWPREGFSTCLTCQIEFYNSEFDNLNQQNFYEKRGLSK